MLVRIGLRITGWQYHPQLVSVAGHEGVRRIGITFARNTVAKCIWLEKRSGCVGERSGGRSQASAGRTRRNAQHCERYSDCAERNSGEDSRIDKTKFRRAVPFHKEGIEIAIELDLLPTDFDSSEKFVDFWSAPSRIADPAVVDTK